MINDILKYLLLIIFIGYMGTISLYSHVHVVNGVTIAHSHPFKKNSAGQPVHPHTQAEFLLIHSLTAFNLTDDIVSQFSFSPFSFYMPENAGETSPALHTVFIAGTVSLRAPPYNG